MASGQPVSLTDTRCQQPVWVRQPHPALRFLLFQSSWPGLVLAVFLLLGMGLMIGALFWGNAVSGVSETLFNQAFLKLLLKAVFQAGISAFFSILLGVFCARALFRRGPFWGRLGLLNLSFLAMIMPTAVAAISLVSLWGRNGFFRQILEWLLPDNLLFAPYGLVMVVLAHVFFNAPLVMRVSFSALQSISQSQMKLATQLRFDSSAYWRVLEGPAIRQVIPSLFGLIFLLCFSSFSLVLMLGGGPSVSTLEVAIYTAVRFEFDLSKAGVFALVQLLISAILILILSRYETVNWTERLDHTLYIARADKNKKAAQFIDIAIILCFCLVVLSPVVSLIIANDVLAGFGLFERAIFWQSLIYSVMIGVGSAVLSTTAGLMLVAARYSAQNSYNSHLMAAMISLSSSAYLVLPSIVLGTASFLLLRHLVDVFSVAFWLVLVSNSVMSLPFCVRILAGRYQNLAKQTDQLALSLNITGFNRVKRILVPALQHEIGLSLGLCCALSMGDFGVIALFGSDNFHTLPWLLYQYASRYGGSEAELLSLVLLCLSLCSYLLLYRLVQFFAQRWRRC